jgi:hypothetical protein
VVEVELEFCIETKFGSLLHCSVAALIQPKERLCMPMIYDNVHVFKIDIINIINDLSVPPSCSEKESSLVTRCL